MSDHVSVCSLFVTADSSDGQHSTGNDLDRNGHISRETQLGHPAALHGWLTRFSVNISTRRFGFQESLKSHRILDGWDVGVGAWDKQWAFPLDTTDTRSSGVHGLVEMFRRPALG